MATTIKDIAKQTGLGLATISKYLNGGNVREENKILIEQAIKDLDYTVNHFARSLKSKKSMTIGVVIPELSNTFITTIIVTIEDILRKKGYSVIICDCHSNSELEKEAIDFLLSKNVDGIINMPYTSSGTHLTHAIVKSVPVIIIDRYIESLGDKLDFVLIDNQKASYMATKYLLEKGHKNIGILLGSKNIYTTGERLAGYNQAMSEYQISPLQSNICHSDYTVQGGYENMRKILKDKTATSVFVTNYEMTLGAIIAINEMDVKIPKDISIIGFDNLQLSQVVHPKLTIVSQPLEEIGTKVSELLLKRLTDGNELPPVTIKLSTDLQIGGSACQLT
ncbi:MAG: LacI family DNA-binding transcriptional regulator [Clostridia bacterium]